MRKWIDSSQKTYENGEVVDQVLVAGQEDMLPSGIDAGLRGLGAPNLPTHSWCETENI